MGQRIKYPVVDGKKECGVCGLWKPITEFRKARRHYESRCDGCAKIYAAEYRKRPEVKKAMLAYSREYRSDPENRKRLNKKTRDWRKSAYAKNQRNVARRAWTAIEKQKAIDYKGGKCCVCGYSKYNGALDFHHRDPSQKDGYGTGALKAHWSFERNKHEIDKCILVCVRCHREIHGGVTECPES